MSYTSLADYHRQRAAQASSSFKKRSQTWFYEEAKSSEPKNWSDWAEEELLDEDSYSSSDYSASESIGSYWWRKSEDPKTSRKDKLERVKRAVARSCNAIRSAVGRGKEMTLKVKWSNGIEGNNNKQNDVIVLSPDTIVRTEIKSDWAEGKRSDALIGDALTAAAQKRTIQPKVVSASMVSDDPNADAARVLWSAVETDVAQNALLNDYKGAAVYFAAANSFHSSDEYRTSIEQAFDDGKTKRSDAACAALAWNVLHQKKLELPEDVRLATQSAMKEFASTKSCADRWQASLRAASILRKLDPANEEEQEKPESKEQSESADGQGETQGQGQGTGEEPNGNDSGEGQGEGQDQGEGQGQDQGEGQGQDQGEGQGQGQDQGEGEGEGNLDSNAGDIINNAGGGIGIGGMLGEAVKNGDPLTWSDEATDVEDLAEDEDEAASALEDLHKMARKTYLRDQTRAEIHTKEATKALMTGYNGLVRKLSALADVYSQVDSFDSFGRRSGILDPNKLWAVTTGDSNVFYRKDDTGEKRELSLAVLVDLSGSTDIDGDRGWVGDQTLEQRLVHLSTYGKHRVSVALKRAATIISEAFRSASNEGAVRVHVYGHIRGEVFYYGNTSNVVTHTYGGGTDEAGAVSKTAVHFLELEHGRNCRKILVSCGDGLTNTYELKDAVDNATKLGLEVYSILVTNRHEGGAKLRVETAFGKGRGVVIPTRNVGLLPTMLSSFVTRVMSRARR